MHTVASRTHVAWRRHAHIRVAKHPAGRLVGRSHEGEGDDEGNGTSNLLVGWGREEGEGGGGRVRGKWESWVREEEIKRRDT